MGSRQLDAESGARAAAVAGASAATSAVAGDLAAHATWSRDAVAALSASGSAIAEKAAAAVSKVAALESRADGDKAAAEVAWAESVRIAGECARNHAHASAGWADARGGPPQATSSALADRGRLAASSSWVGCRWEDSPQRGPLRGRRPRRARHPLRTAATGEQPPRLELERLMAAAAVVVMVVAAAAVMVVAAAAVRDPRRTQARLRLARTPRQLLAAPPPRQLLAAPPPRRLRPALHPQSLLWASRWLRGTTFRALMMDLHQRAS